LVFTSLQHFFLSLLQEIKRETEIKRGLWELRDISAMEPRWEIVFWIIVNIYIYIYIYL
jgi:hypothetical protein